MSKLSEHLIDEIRELPAKYPQPRSAVMPEKAQGGQAPPAVSPPLWWMAMPSLDGSRGPALGVPAKSTISWGEAKPVHADTRTRG
jgi:hypothetical protein